jgi:hypothetical protein
MLSSGVGGCGSGRSRTIGMGLCCGRVVGQTGAGADGG